MKQVLSGAWIVAVALSAGIALGDTVTLKDGTSREGTVVGQNETEVRLHINEDGMQATVSIPMSNVAKITTGPVKAATPAVTSPTTPSRAPTSAVPTATGRPPAASTISPSQAIGKGHPTTSPATSPGGTAMVLPTRGFLAEMGSALIGRGPGDPRRLPPEIQKEWQNTITLDAAGKRANELDSMRALDAAFAGVADGSARLDGVSRHERDQPFGLWMAGVHWEVMGTNYRGGNFDLNDVREIERPALIGLLKEKTGSALEPLKTYFPPMDEKTGRQAAFKPAQLQGISVDNALDTKDKALLAHAILLAQIKLQPDMPAADKQLLFGQLANVNHILSRVSDLEPQARAAAAKKKLADDRAKAKGNG